MKPLTRDSILSGLATRYVGRTVTYLPSTGSTNDLARALAEEGAAEGTLVIADEQTQGRGRLGRRWIAPAGSSLLMSLLFRPPLAASQANRVTMLCSLAMVEAMEILTGLPVGIKWPNDVVVLHPAGERCRASESEIGRAVPSLRKVAGLLAESSLIGERLAYLIVGMGINVSVSPQALAGVAFPATSLFGELGRPVDRLALLWEILAGIERRYEAAKQAAASQETDPPAGFAAIHREWSARLVTKGQWVRVSEGDTVTEGKAEDVNEDGALLVRGAGGQLRRIAVGDVSLREPG